MQIKTISFTYERKWNTGNYESATVGMSAWADIAEDEDPVGAARELERFVKAEVKQQSLPLLGERSARVKEFFAGLPVEGNGKEMA
jgi:hypothetical protein